MAKYLKIAFYLSVISEVQACLQAVNYTVFLPNTRVGTNDRVLDIRFNSADECETRCTETCCSAFTFNMCRQCELYYLDEDDVITQKLVGGHHGWTLFLKLNSTDQNGPRNCLDILHGGNGNSGVYMVNPGGNETQPFAVYCDMETDGGGWLVFQKRQDGSVDFYRDWAQYKHGFGFSGGEFWLGNEHLYELTRYRMFELRVDLVSYGEEEKVYAKYAMFAIGSEEEKYKLTVGNYQGTAGDSLIDHHNGQPFSTKDRDNDSESGGSCAVAYTGAWWYKKCHRSNLNGQYLRGDHPDIYAKGMTWYAFKGHRHSLKVSEMKIRPLE